MIEKVATSIGKALIPPELKLSPVLLWRLTVSGSILALGGVLALHIMSASSEIADVKRNQLEEMLDKVHTVICEAQSNGQQIPSALRDRARNLEREYREVSGEEYEVDCELLLALRD